VALMLTTASAIGLIFVAPVDAQTLGAPTLRYVVEGEGSLTVAWMPPTSSSGVIAYDARYIESASTSKSDGSAWTIKSDVGTTNSLVALLDGLTDGVSYDVAVRARSDSLTSDWSSVMSGTPSDPGASVATASAVYDSVPLYAELSSATDIDFFSFTVAAESEYIVWSSGDTDTMVELTMSDGSSHSPPITHNNSGIEPGPNNFMLYGSATPGTYFVKVTSGSQADSATPLWQPSGDYTLHLHLAPDTTGYSDATAVMLNSKASGVLAQQDRDFFKIELPTDTTISAHIESPAFGSLVGQIVDSSGEIVALGRPSFLEPYWEHFALNVPLGAGTYYIVVAVPWTVTGDPYFLHVNESPLPSTKRDEAVNLPLGVVAGGTASHDSEALFRIELSEPLAIEVSSSSSVVGEMKIELWDQDGQIIAGGASQESRQLRQLTSQSYLLTLQSLGIREYLEAGVYYLNVNFLEAGTVGQFLTVIRPDYQYARQLRICQIGQPSVDDHLYGCQWHLHNTGQLAGAVSGEDINLGDVWAATKGEDITVTVVDQGIDYAHPDLRDNFDLATSGSAFGDPVVELANEATNHGTKVAGIIAARDNEIGVVGVAPRASISAYQLLGFPEADLAGLVEAFSLYAEDVSIRNHSWNPRQRAPRTVLPEAVKRALNTARTLGDGGRGTLQIQAAGNLGPSGEYTSHNRYLNYRGFVAVCGVDDQGEHYSDSAQGPNLWICAPTQGVGRPGIATTDRAGRYQLDFSGTSASAPMVSGVAALVRSVNRDLSWRDTKLILADSARVVKPGDASWESGATKYSSASQTYRYSHKFGFGVVNAERAVERAQNWKLLPDEESVSATQSTPFTIADTQTAAAQSTVAVDGSVTFVEHVKVTLDIESQHFRDLDIELVSPSGTISKLSVPFQCLPFHDCDVSGMAALSSTRHLGEDSRGNWTLRVTDSVNSGTSSTVSSWSIEIYGHTRAQVVSPATVWVSEGAGSVSIELSGDPLLSTMVTATLSTGTASGGSDCSTGGTDFDDDVPAVQTLSKGASSHTLSAIVVCSDTENEGDETFTVALTASSGVFDTSEAHCSSSTECIVTVVIIDDDLVVKVPSDWGLIPSGLNAGDRFRLLFRTSAERDATASDIAVYDSFVQSLASAPEAHADLGNYAEQFKVFGSTQAVSARTHNALWNTSGWVDGSRSSSSSGVPIYWLNGAKYADNYFGFCAYSSLSSSEKTALENQFHYGNIRSESGAVETMRREPFTGTGQSCETSETLFLGASPNVAHGAAGAVSAGGNAWDVSPWAEGTTSNSETRPFYALSPVFIASADPLVNLTVTPTSVAEGESVAISVSISEAQSAPLTIPLTYIDETAVSSADYTAVNSLVIPANMTASSTVMLSIVQDSFYESDETFSIALGKLPDSVQAGATSKALVTITDETDRPQMTIDWTGGATTVNEGAMASFTVTANRASSFDQSIVVSTQQATSDPIAMSDIDFAALRAQVVTMTAGTTTAFGAVTTTSDRLDEAAREKLRVVLDAPLSSAEYTIDSTDNESADLQIVDQNPTVVKLAVVGGTAAIAEAGGSKLITLRTARPLVGMESLTVQLTLTGTAQAGTDYELSANCVSGVACNLTTDPSNPTIIFTAGGQTASITLTTLQDMIDEGTHETVVIGVNAFSSSDWVNLDGGAVGVGRATTFTITDDDLPQSLEAPVVQHVIAGEKSLSVAWAISTVTVGVVGYDVRYIESTSTSKNDDSAWTIVENAWNPITDVGNYALGGLTAVVDGLTDGTSYDVQVRTRTASFTSDWSSNQISATPTEPGSTVSEALTVHSGATVHAELSSINDVDFYTFTVTTESEYMIWTTGDTDTLGELTQSDGTSRTPRIVHDDIGSRGGEADNFWLFGSITPGTYFFKVTPGSLSSSSHPLWNGIGPYALHLHLSQDTTGRNDAQRITLGSKNPGQLVSPGNIIPDLDVFELVLPTDTTISAHVELPAFVVAGQILDSEGNVVAPTQAGYLEPAGIQPAFHEVLTAGTYYISLYSASIPTQDEPYFLYVSESPSAVAVRSEAPLLPSHTVAGGIASHDTDSFFRLEVEQEAMVELSGSSRAGEMSVELQDEHGTSLPISVYKDIHTEPLSTIYQFTVREYLEAGTYYLNIKFTSPSVEGRFLTLMHSGYEYAQQVRQCPSGQLNIDDHLHGCQWHLHNTAQFAGAVSGEDINLGNVWEVTKGEGVTVTVVDEGIDYLHIDLRNNFDLATSGSAFGDPLEELLKEDDEHGTLVAAVIAARDDGVGIAGVAPRATISAYQIFDNSGAIADMSGLIEAFSLHSADVSIRNHSWGPNVVAPIRQLPAAIRIALDTARTVGDSGRGTLQIQAAGNENLSGGYTSFNRYLNYRNFVGVCGVDDQGKSVESSNQGPNLWVCGNTRSNLRVGITSTRTRNGYWPNFGGTSAAAPTVSGVAALVRSANRNLSWRDTKLILADSARGVELTDSSWSEGAAKYSKPSQKYRYSHKLGFGIVDAEQAVALAQDWTPLPAETSHSVTNNNEVILDFFNSTYQESVDFTGSATFVEHVEVTLDIEAVFFRDLDIELESPSGTISKLSVPFTCRFEQECSIFGTAVMSSARHLGENPQGSWTLRITDVLGSSSFPNTIRSWTLQVYGHVRAEMTSSAALSVSPTEVTEGDSLSYEITLDRAPGTGNTATVNFITVGGTATAGEDYTPVLAVGANAITFGPTETSKTVIVNTLRGDIGDDEPTETLRAFISRATLYFGNDSAGTPLAMNPHTVSVQIKDHPDDVTQAWFEAAVPGVVKNGEEAQFVARIDNPLSSDIILRYRTQRPATPITFYNRSVSRANSGDYVAAAFGSVTIVAGETSTVFTVATADDADSDYEFFRVRHRGLAPVGTSWRSDNLGGTSANMVIEPDTENNTVYVVAEPEAPQEGDTVKLSAHFSQGLVAADRINVTITAAASDGATDDDFTLTDGLLRISRDEQSSASTARQSGEINISEDADYDPDETISLTAIANRRTLKALAPTISIDNTTPLSAELSFTASNEDGIVSEGGTVGVTVSLGRTLRTGETIDVTLRLTYDEAGTILGDLTLVSAGNSETGFSIVSALADVARAHPRTNRSVTYQEMVLRFSGAGARSGTLTLTFGDDGVAADPMLTVALSVSEISATGIDEEVAVGAKSILLISVETEGLEITPQSLIVNEGTTAIYQVLLRSDPGEAVTVKIVSDDESVMTVNPSLLTFSSSGTDVWSTPQMVTVTAISDDDGFDGTASITHAVSGYGNVTAGPAVLVLVSDDDIASYTVPYDWSLIPSGVGFLARDSFRLVFATSETTTASSDHINFYNKFVERAVAGGHADIRSYAKGFSAWLSTTDVDARDNTRTNPTSDGIGHSVYWLGSNVKVADFNAGLYGDGTSGWGSNTAGRDEDGSSVSANTTAWWGSSTDGTKLTSNYVAADAEAVKLTDIGNPTDASTFYVESRRENRVLAISPVFTIEDRPIVNISSDAQSVTEADTVTFTVSSLPAPSSDLTVNLAVSEENVSDFVDDSVLNGLGSITIDAGVNSKTFTVPITNDTIDESNALLVAIVQPGDDYIVGSSNTAAVWVQDDDPTTVTLSGSAGSLVEGGERTFTLSIGRSLIGQILTAETLTVPLTFGGDADHRSDYTLACETPLPTGVTCDNFAMGVPQVTFAAPNNNRSSQSASSVTLTVTAVDDGSVEASGETVDINIGTVTHSALEGGVATPTDNFGEFTINDVPMVSFGAASYSVTEGGSVAVTVKLNTVQATATTVAITATSGTAASSDYMTPSNVTISASDSTATLTISAIQDTIVEASETFTIKIGTLPAGVLKGSVHTATVTISDDNDSAIVQIERIGTASVTEASNAKFRLTANQAVETPVTVNLTHTENFPSGAVDSAYDFVAATSGTAVIPANSDRVTYTVATTADTTDEPDADVVVAIASGTRYSTGTNSSAMVKVNDDDLTTVTLAGDTSAITEGSSKVFTVSIGRPMYDQEEIAFDFLFSGTAVVATDYSLACPSTLPSGVTCANINSAKAKVTFAGDDQTGIGGDVIVSAKSVNITLEALEDPDAAGETVDVGMSSIKWNTLAGGVTATSLNPQTFTDSFGEFVINDKPKVPTLSFSTASYSVAEGSTLTGRVNLNPTKTTDTTVEVTTTPGTAKSGDYASSSFNVTIAAGDSHKDFTVATTDDAIVEVSETFSISLGTAPQGTELGVLKTAVVTVTDTDTALVTIARAGDATVTEGAARNFTVSTTAALETDLTVALAINEDDTDVSDFVKAVSDEVVIASGAKSVTYSLQTTEDALDEPHSEVEVEVTAGSRYSPASVKSASVQVVDNDNTAVTLSGTATALTEGRTKDFTVQIGRGLYNGEVLTVSLSFGGTATTAVRGTDYTLSCESPLPTGVTCANLDSGSATVTFTGPASGQSATSVEITLSAKQDDTDEAGGENVDIGLTAAGTGLDVATPTDNFGEFAINDVPPLPTVNFAAASYSVTEGGVAAVTISINPTRSSDTVIDLSYAHTTARVSDYMTLPSSVTIAAGAESTTFNVASRQDTLQEGSEYTDITIGSQLPTGVVLGSPSTTRVTIADDEPLTVELSSSSLMLFEGGESTTITVMLGRELRTGESLNVPLSLAGVATQGVDYTLTSMSETGVTYTGVNTTEVSIAFSSGASRAVLELSAIDDDVYELSGESLTVTMGALSYTSGVGTTINPVTAGSPLTFTVLDPADQTQALSLQTAGTVTDFEDFYIAEGGVGTLRVSLATAPTTEVTATVTISSGLTTLRTSSDILRALRTHDEPIVIQQSDPATITSGAVLTFTPTDYRDKAVVISAIDDSDAKELESVLVRISLDSTDPQYSGMTFQQPVRVVDDDLPISIRVSSVSINDVEGNQVHKVFFTTNRRVHTHITSALLEVAFTSTAGDFKAFDARRVSPPQSADYDVRWLINSIRVGESSGYIYMPSRDDNRVEQDAVATATLSLSGTLPGVSVDPAHSTFTVNHIDDDELTALIFRNGAESILQFSKPRDFPLFMELQAKSGVNLEPLTLAPDIRRVVLPDLDELAGIVLRTPEGFRIARSGWFRGTDGVVLRAHGDGTPSVFSAFRLSSEPAAKILPKQVLIAQDIMRDESDDVVVEPLGDDSDSVSDAGTQHDGDSSDGDVGVDGDSDGDSSDGDVGVDGDSGVDADSDVDSSDGDAESTEWKPDPDVVADVRRYAAETWHGEAHVERWKRVLIGLGVEASAGLTAMTSAEAQTYLDLGWARWAPVVIELKKAEKAATVTVLATQPDVRHHRSRPNRMRRQRRRLLGPTVL